MLLFIWFSLALTCLGLPFVYFVYMQKSARKPWDIKIDLTYKPAISILIPTYNEGPVIQYKLQNLARLEYPKNLMQLIIVDSASDDDTIEKIQVFKQQNPSILILLIQESERKGKSSALNVALEHASGDVVIVSDADCFWSSDILAKALPYLADPKVGAVAGQEKLLNPHQSWVTKTESLYRDRMFNIQLGESKFYSTVQFEGGFGAYNRKALDGFDTETGSDDSGTALNLVNKGFRTLVLPEALFYTFFPPTWKGKITIKTRRAQQFFWIHLKCFKSMLSHDLSLPKRIFLPPAFFLLINPFIFILFISSTLLLLFQFPYLALLPLALILIPKTRVYLVELFQNNLVALLATIEGITGKQAIIWTKAVESRKNFDAEVLKKHGLIN